MSMIFKLYFNLKYHLNFPLKHILVKFSGNQRFLDGMI
jgi:hypothetical protein